jgi:hypothetical protein
VFFSTGGRTGLTRKKTFHFLNRGAKNLSEMARDKAHHELELIKEIRHQNLSRQGAVAMGKTRSLFIYKCTRGHVTERTFPLGTKYDGEDETTCMPCLDSGDLNTAYLVWAEPTSAREKRNGKSTA